MDWARLRWAAFAEAKAAKFAPPLREAVAPMTTMLPVFAFRISGMTCFAQARQPKAFTRQDPLEGLGGRIVHAAELADPAL